MKYDLEKCNNLNFRLKDGTLGFIKVAPSGFVYLYYDREACKKDWDVDAMMPKDFFMTNFSDEESFNLFIKEKGLEIVPRNPETYVDWKVGDKVICNKGNHVETIIAVLGKAIVLVRDAEVPITCLTTADNLTKYDKLILTDYEQELLAEQEKEKCPFKKGDRVLVRDYDDEKWHARIFDNYDKERKYKYECEDDDDRYMQCIPYNEHTWDLLETTDEYKEE